MMKALDIYLINDLFLYMAIFVLAIGLITYLYLLYFGLKNKNFSRLSKKINVIILIMYIGLILGIIGILIK